MTQKQEFIDTLNYLQKVRDSIENLIKETVKKIHNLQDNEELIVEKESMRK